MSNSSSTLQRSFGPSWLALLCIGGAVGCAGNAAERPTIRRLGPGSEGVYSSGAYGTRVPSDLALGASQRGAQRAVDEGAIDLEPYLLAQAPRNGLAKAKAAAKTAKPKQVAVAQVAAKPAPSAATPGVAPDATPPAKVTEASKSEADLYAAREARSQKQQQYQGGDAIVISATTLVIILLVVILILLLT